MKNTILVVEDEEALASIIKIKLEKNGFKVVSARTAEQALGYLKDELNVQAIWLDHYLLGKENGLDLVVKIKENNSKWHNIPIFVVSNTASPEKVNAYLALGVNKYYTKANFRLENIVNDIKNHLIKEDV